jgi:aminopeptidase YwaD
MDRFLLQPDKKENIVNNNSLIKKAGKYLHTLCSVKPNRRTGSPGNSKAVRFVASTVKKWGYAIDTTPFPSLDFDNGIARLRFKGGSYRLTASPFANGCDVTAELVTVTTVKELKQCRCAGKVLLLKGPVCAEQLMPKNFVFYNPDHHKRIYALLDEKNPAAIITATGKNPELVGGEYPFAMIEDGDFDIPSVYCKDRLGEKIAARSGQTVRLKSTARRIASKSSNVIASKNRRAKKKIVMCAHIDARANTPGATDDASGVVTLMLLAEMLKNYKGKMGIEIIAFNGEDYYSAGGQMDYLRRYGKELRKIALAINIDDIGYIKGKSAFSLYQCPAGLTKKAIKIFTGFDGIMQGKQWFQGDHMIFVQQNIAAIAFTAEKMKQLLATITHTPGDHPGIVDCAKLVEAAHALKSFIERF